MNFLELMAQRANGTQSPAILPEAAIMRLREAAALYAEQIEGPRFRVGDLVTPRKDSREGGAGRPHVVVEVRSGAAPLWGKDCCGRFGSRHDIRVLYLNGGGDVTPHWSESFEYELWTEASAPAAA